MFDVAQPQSDKTAKRNRKWEIKMKEMRTWCWCSMRLPLGLFRSHNFKRIRNIWACDADLSLRIFSCPSPSTGAPSSLSISVIRYRTGICSPIIRTERLAVLLLCSKSGARYRKTEYCKWVFQQKKKKNFVLSTKPKLGDMMRKAVDSRQIQLFFSHFCLVKLRGMGSRLWVKLQNRTEYNTAFLYSAFDIREWHRSFIFNFQATLTNGNSWWEIYLPLIWYAVRSNRLIRQGHICK